MKSPIIDYQIQLKKLILDKLNSDFKNTNPKNNITNLLESFEQDKRSKDFQNYYFQITGNIEEFNINNNFFSQFKYQYGLQGVTKNYLSHLENNKLEILELIESDELSTLYCKYFRAQKIKFGDKIQKRDYVSFFSKLVHTFKPEKYCALDNPIKEYFGLKKESFFLSFFAVSEAYLEFSSSNTKIIDEFRQGLKESNETIIFKGKHISDLKILDLIYWTIANSK